MPDLIRHPAGLERTGFRLEFTPYLIRGFLFTFIFPTLDSQLFFIVLPEEDSLGKGHFNPFLIEPLLDP